MRPVQPAVQRLDTSSPFAGYGVANSVSQAGEYGHAGVHSAGDMLGLKGTAGQVCIAC